MNCLVTGSTGLVGAHLLAHLAQSHLYTVRALKRKTSKMDTLRYVFGFYSQDIDSLLDTITWIEGDILDKDSLAIAMEGIQVVFHCAADVVIGEDITGSVLKTNVQGTQNIVDVALQKKIQILCYVSSVAAIGQSITDSYPDENALWDSNQPHSVYAQSKYETEQVVFAIPRNQMRVIVVNPGVILGVNNNKHGSSAVIYLAKKGLPFYTQGGSGYVDVREVCKAMLLLVQSSVTHERFILVGENCTTKQLLTYFAQGFQHTPPFILMPKWLLCIFAWCAEILSTILKAKGNFNRKSIQTALHTSFYSAEKMKQRFNFHFTPMHQCIEDICKYIN
mgnify:FL=1